jgi:hypothetical protein
VIDKPPIVSSSRGFNFLKLIQRETLEAAQAAGNFMSDGGEIRMYLASPLESDPKLDPILWWHNMR